MLSIHRLPQERASLDYLADASPLGMRWAGQLADDPELRLAGEHPCLEHAWTLSQGFSPRSGELLKTDGTPAPGRPKRRKERTADDEPSPNARGLGLDITVCAPLGLSMLVGAVGATQREQLLHAHRQAVDATVRFLEDQLHHRFIVLQVDHPKHDGCAFVHTHNVVFSLSRIAGAWAAFNPQELYRQVEAGSAVYRSALKALTPHG